MSGTGKTWFTSDLHLGHQRLCDINFRKFSNSEECDKVMLDNFNSVIKPGDRIFILGDLTINAPYDYVAQWLHNLKGQKIIIQGNHDRRSILDKLKEDKIICNWHSFKGCKCDDYSFFLCHFPLADWHCGNDTRIHLHGHSHGMLKEKLWNRIDVGVDCWNYKPVDVLMILNEMSLRTSL